MQKILVTGFEPFGGEKINPALEIIKKLAGMELNGNKIVTVQIPVVQKKSIITLEAAIDEISPDIILAIGQAGGRSEITVERVAINVDDYRIKDNEGNQPIDQPVVDGAPNAYFSTLPLKAIIAALHAQQIPASISNTAGTFVCNHLFFGLMHCLAQKGNRQRGGFMHIPFLPSQVVDKPNTASMALELMVNSVVTILQTTLQNEVDIKKTGGTIC